MGFIRYLGLWLQLVLRHSLGRADTTTIAIVIVLGASSWFSRYLPEGKPYPAPVEFAMQLTEWQIATAVLGVIVLARLILAPYWMYKKVEKERDGLKGQLSIIPTNGVVVIKPQLVIRILDVEFGLSGDSGYPLLNSDKARWIRLSLSFEWTGDVFIETLELVVSGKEPILAHGWRPGEVGYYYYFQIPEWVKSSEERSIQVQAFANGVKWGSPERSIKLPAL